MEHYKAIVLASITGVLGVLGVWVANRVLGKAAFQTSINQGFMALLAEVRKEKDELRELVESERIRHDEERSQWRLEKDQLHGEIRQLQQTLESMRKIANGKSGTN